VSATKSQQVMSQGPAGDLPISSKRQPSRSSRAWPGGIEPGLAATALAALSLSLVLFYAMASAVTTRNGYRAIGLRREIEDLQAQEALLRYQINLTQSQQRIAQAASRLDLRPADPVREVDYVVLPSFASEAEIKVAEGNGGQGQRGVAAVLAGLASGVVDSAGGCAEASTGQGHRP